MRTFRWPLTVLACLALVAGGCRSSGRERPMGRLERRAAMVRGAVDNQWQALGRAIEQGQAVHPEYVYHLATLRHAALAIELRTAMLRLFPEERPEAEEAISAAEEALPILLATPMDQPPGPLPEVPAP